MIRPNPLHGLITPIILGGLSALGYLIYGPLVSVSPEITTLQVFMNVFRHGDLAHLVLNVILIYLGGSVTEEILGIAKTWLLVMACILFGTLAQLMAFGPEFVGISGPAYGLIAYSTLAKTPRDRQILMAGAIACLLALEAILLSHALSIFVHIVSAFIGGSAAMFKSMFGKSGPHLKQMERAHISKVVQIINETDEDDAADAEDGFLNGGLENMFVLMERGKVLGVTGFSLDQQVDDIAWLSWTYLSADQTGYGLGRQMMNDLLGKLKDRSIRKVFIATSDYREGGKMIYEKAHGMYKSFGARAEMTIPKYHSPTEAQIIYGLNNPDFEADRTLDRPEKIGINLLGIDQDPETEGAYVIRWEEATEGLRGVAATMEEARSKKARLVVLAIPSDISAANTDMLRSEGFEICGKLTEYYSTSLHQVTWTCLLG